MMKMYSDLEINCFDKTWMNQVPVEILYYFPLFNTAKSLPFQQQEVLLRRRICVSSRFLLQKSEIPGKPVLAPGLSWFQIIT